MLSGINLYKTKFSLSDLIWSCSNSLCCTTTYFSHQHCFQIGQMWSIAARSGLYAVLADDRDRDGDFPVWASRWPSSILTHLPRWAPLTKPSPGASSGSQREPSQTTWHRWHLNILHFQTHTKINLDRKSLQMGQLNFMLTKRTGASWQASGGVSGRGEFDSGAQVPDGGDLILVLEKSKLVSRIISTIWLSFSSSTA